MVDRFTFRVWHKGKEHMYKNVAIGVGTNKIGYKMSGKKRYVWEETDNIVVNQCTGYRDRTDKRIFDGDILGFESGKTKSFSVHWKDTKFILKKLGSRNEIDNPTYWKKLQKGKVVGNIYENPELLKKS